MRAFICAGYIPLKRRLIDVERADAESKLLKKQWLDDKKRALDEQAQKEAEVLEALFKPVAVDVDSADEEGAGQQAEGVDSAPAKSKAAQVHPTQD